MIEYSWALTGIVGLSLIGFLIAATGWRTPFFLLAAGMAGMSLLFGILPGERRLGASAGGSGGAVGTVATKGAPHLPLLRRIAAMAVIHTNRRSTYATMLAGALSYFAASQIMIAHGAWLTMEYGLDAAALGMVALVFGCFDLAASVTVSLVADRLGKKKSVLIGIVGSLVFYILMPLVDRSLIPTVLVIAGARMFFEFNIVSHFPLLSEQVPDQRGRAMSLSAAVTLLAGTAAGFSGPWLLVNLGIPALALTSAAAVSLSLIVALVLVKEQAQGRVVHGAE
jgi:predicted MFS family arabinose efflux permease